MTNLTPEERRIVECLRSAKSAVKPFCWYHFVSTVWLMCRPQTFLELVYKAVAEAIERGEHREKQDD